MAKMGVVYLFVLALFLGTSTAENCGRQAGNALCQNGECCSKFGWCGLTPEHCGKDCQSQCSGSNPSPTPATPSGGGNGVGSIITEALFNQMLKHIKDPRCPSNGFYTYSAFITAASGFSGFGTTGDLNTRKRELAAFFGQTSHETTGGTKNAQDQFEWGYCFVREGSTAGAYCSSDQWPCPAGKMYYGRGPIQLTGNYNYGLAGKTLQLDLINNPDQVATNAVTSFRTGIWFWMTPQGNKPSSHDVIIGRWTPSETDRAAGRVPGYGVITNIINGGLECGMGKGNAEVVAKVVDRIGYYKRYCDMLGVGYGNNLDCYNQQKF